MQTTLLGFAIAIILALVAALVGPFFVDWGSYRGEFETRASRLTGLDFHVTGANGASGGKPFPTECDNGPLSPQEKVLEFMLFDLASCIQKDTTPPSPPR